MASGTDSAGGPLQRRSGGVSLIVVIIKGSEHVGEIRDQLVEALEKASYAIREVEVTERFLQASPLISHARWSSTAED
jgi:hypothetical protein